MREIERHIVRLLLDNDCVIVPGFGGFLAHRIPASYNKADNERLIAGTGIRKLLRYQLP